MDLDGRGEPLEKSLLEMVEILEPCMYDTICRAIP
jgi:hypothetical protein